MQKRVLVAMSGGVDSSVAALLLQRQGYEVAGATFELFDGCSEDNTGDARRVCERLGIPHFVFDYRERFSKGVLDYFIHGYQNGETPNPCIACNKTIKFGAFSEEAERLGFDFISTGHYAGVQLDRQSGQFWLLRSQQERKDQSYVLYHLSQEQLSRLLLPIDRYSKAEVREIAAQARLPVFSKSDSQDICFVPDGDYAGFITRYTGELPQEGDYLDDNGTVIGRHKGVLYYTIGQRRGLGIALGVKRTVSHLDPVSNTVTLSDDSAVYTDRLFADDLRMTDDSTPERPFPCTAKIRYAHRPASATVHPLGNGSVQVQFAQPQRAVTKGQAVVFYEGDRVLGGATIR